MPRKGASTCHCLGGPAAISTLPFLFYSPQCALVATRVPELHKLPAALSPRCQKKICLKNSWALGPLRSAEQYGVQSISCMFPRNNARDRQRKEKCRPRTGFALDPGMPVVGLHQPLHDAQAQADPRAITTLGLPNPVKNVRQIRFRDTLPGIAHGKPRVFMFGSLGSVVGVALLMTELYGISLNVSNGLRPNAKNGA